MNDGPVFRGMSLYFYKNGASLRTVQANYLFKVASWADLYEGYSTFNTTYATFWGKSPLIDTSYSY